MGVTEVGRTRKRGKTAASRQNEGHTPGHGKTMKRKRTARKGPQQKSARNTMGRREGEAGNQGGKNQEKKKNGKKKR